MPWPQPGLRLTHGWLLGTWLPAVPAATRSERYAAVPTLLSEHRLHKPAVAEQLRRVVATAFFEELRPATDWLRTAPAFT